MKFRYASGLGIALLSLSMLSLTIGCGSAAEDEASAEGKLEQTGGPAAPVPVRPGRFRLTDVDVDGSVSGPWVHSLELQTTDEGGIAILSSHCLVCDVDEFREPRRYPITATLESGLKVYKSDASGAERGDSIRIVDYRPGVAADLLVEETVSGVTSRRDGWEFVPPVELSPIESCDCIECPHDPACRH